MSPLTLKNLITHLMIAAGIVLSPTLFAQGLYLDLNTGYAFPIAGQSEMRNSISTHSYNEQNDAESLTETSKTVNLSLGKGFNFGMNMGYMFNKNLGVDLGLSYLTGGKTESQDIRTNIYIDDTGFESTTIEENHHAYSSKMFQITPSIVFSAGFEKFNPYAKMGAIVSYGSVLAENYYDETTYRGSVNHVEEFSGGFGLGFSGSFGATYPLGEKSGLFCELNFISMSYTPTDSEVTTYELSGFDQLGNLSTRGRRTVYEKEPTIHEVYNTYPQYTIPYVAPQFSFPASSMGFKLGVRFNL